MRRTLIFLVLVIILIGGGFYVFSRNTTNSIIPPTKVGVGGGPQSTQNRVIIQSNGFSPMSITIKSGDAVTWVNNDTTTHTVNSNPHPIHTDYPALNVVGEILPGLNKSFTFPKSGTYGYHDHYHPENRGTIIVQ